MNGNSSPRTQDTNGHINGTSSKNVNGAKTKNEQDREEEDQEVLDEYEKKR